MDFHKLLKDLDGVVEVEKYDFTSKFSFESSYELRKTADTHTQNVDTYRLVYQVNELKVVGYLCAPKNIEKMPLILHLRGGTRNFSMLSEKSIYQQMVRFSNEGYAVASTQYPGVEGGDGKDGFGSRSDIDSIVKLKDIICQLPFIDSEKIAIKGHSRGGLMAYMLLKEYNWIRAAVIISAPTDQFRQAEFREGWKEHQISMWGDDKEETLRRSPAFWVDKLNKETPILLMHGASDWRVDPTDSIEMSQKLYENKIPHRFILYEGSDHSLSEQKDDYYKQILSWLTRFIKLNESLPNSEPHGL